MHLRDYENTGETEGEHRPELIALHNGDQRAMHQNENFQREGPPAVQVYPGEYQAALDHEKEHVEEADQVAAGAFHGVIPECVHDRPGKYIAVIFTRETVDFIGEFYFFAKEQAAAGILHQ